MNGRVYDPVLGRFLSADPNVDGAYDSQGYNRYSYVQNNPINATDPSGYRIFRDVFKQALFLGPHILLDPMYWGSTSTFNQYYGQAAGTAIGIVAFIYSWNPAIAGAAAGSYSAFATSLLNGGSIGDAFKSGLVGGVVGGVSGYLTGEIGNTFGGYGDYGVSGEIARAALHGAVSGGVTEAMGGEFRHGFYAGAAGSLLGGATNFRANSDDLGSVMARTAVAAVVGGTASVIGGGKFANGAVTAAFQHLFNSESEGLRNMVRGAGAPYYISSELAQQSAAQGALADAATLVDEAGKTAERVGDYAVYAAATGLEETAVIGEAATVFGSNNTILVGDGLKLLNDYAKTPLKSLSEGLTQTQGLTPWQKVGGAGLKILNWSMEYGQPLSDYGTQQRNAAVIRFHNYVDGNWSAQFYPR